MVDGHRLGISSITLRGGKIVLTCTAKGPLPACDGGAITVFGEDGAGVCQGYSVFAWSEISPYEMLSFNVAVGFESCHGDAEVPVMRS